MSRSLKRKVRKRISDNCTENEAKENETVMWGTTMQGRSHSTNLFSMLTLKGHFSLMSLWKRFT